MPAAAAAAHLPSRRGRLLGEGDGAALALDGPVLVPHHLRIRKSGHDFNSSSRGRMTGWSGSVEEGARDELCRVHFRAVPGCTRRNRLPHTRTIHSVNLLPSSAPANRLATNATAVSHLEVAHGLPFALQPVRRHEQHQRQHRQARHSLHLRRQRRRQSRVNSRVCSGSFQQQQQQQQRRQDGGRHWDNTGIMKAPHERAQRTRHATGRAP